METPCKRQQLGKKTTPPKEADGNHSSKDDQGKGKSRVDLLIVQVQKMNRQYHTVVSAAKALCAQIESGDKDWAWANNAENKGLLKKELENLQVNMAPISQQILIGELPKLKASMGEEHLIVQLQEFLSVKDNLSAVANRHSCLLAMKAKAL